MRVTVVTYLPSPYQVELFDAVARVGEIELTVVYLRERLDEAIAGLWHPVLQGHRALVLRDGRATTAAREACASADLAVFNYYRHAAALELLGQRARAGAAWCFWGERFGVGPWPRLGAAYRYFRLGALRRSRAAIWGIGRMATERYRETYGAQRRYFNVPYFSDLARFAARAVEPRAKAGARTFLFSGALIQRKGVDLLASAFEQTVLRAPQSRLLVLGAGPLEATLKAQFASRSDAVRFAGGQPWEALPQWYTQADVLVAPSRHDGWAMVVPEALAAGLPVIGTRATGAACEFIEPGVNGWLIDAGDEAALAEAMCEAVELPADRFAVCAQAARAATACHQLADGVRRFHEAACGSREGFG